MNSFPTSKVPSVVQRRTIQINFYFVINVYTHIASCATSHSGNLFSTKFGLECNRNASRLTCALQNRRLMHI